MAQINNKAKTVRNLKREAPWGQPPYAFFIANRREIEFWTDAAKAAPNPMNLKPGAVFYNDSSQSLVTIQGGAGHSWMADQPFQSTGNGITGFYTSMRTADRGRNSAGVLDTDEIIAGLLVPDATHFVYQSAVDDAGNPDYYVYVDTVEPERGVHPYTRDVAIASFKTPPKTTVAASTPTGRMIMDISNRGRSLEGAMRAGRTLGSASQDYRIANAVARAYAIERYLNGQAGVPAVGSNATYTDDQFMFYGEGGNA